MPRRSASAKFVVGPASDTISMSRRRLRSRAGLTGTGLAQPMTGTCASAPSTGRMIEPNGSMCGIGLSVSRPAAWRCRHRTHDRNDAVADLVQDDRDDQRGEEDDGDAVDVHAESRRQRRLRRARHAEPRRGHRFEPGLGDVLAARLAVPVGAGLELAERVVDLEQRLAQRPDERVDLAPFGGDLTGVGEALVVRAAVDTERSRARR